MVEFLEKLKSNWIILAFVVGVILWYGNTNSRLTAVEAQVQETITSGQTDSEKISQLVIDVAVIKSILASDAKATKTSDAKIDTISAKIDLIIRKVN